MLSEPPSILITDDDAGFRQTLGEVLAPRGFCTLQASDGREALDIVRSRDIHLVLLDMHMPRLTGLETIREVKRFKSQLPCILISGDLDETLRRQATAAEVFSILSKPVSGREITRVVELALRSAYNWSDFKPL
jgi:CheY-like chemotaxis protein